MNERVIIDTIYGCMKCRVEDCDLVGRQHPSDYEAARRIRENDTEHTLSYSSNSEISNRDFKVLTKTFPKTYTCKYCGKDDLIWQETPVGWRLYDKNGNPHLCDRYKNEIRDIYDAVKFLQECVYLSKPIFNSNGQVVDLIDGYSSIEIEAVKINPKINEVDDIQSLNTQTRLWAECGYYSLTNRCWTHDIQFDIGASSLDELFISIAKAINLKYPYLRKDFDINEVLEILQKIEEEGGSLNDEYEW